MGSLSGLGTLGLAAGVRRRAGLIRSPCRPRSCCLGVAVLGFAAGAWVPVGLLLGLVVIHPVRVCVCACVRVCVCACVRVVGVDEAIKGH